MSNIRLTSTQCLFVCSSLICPSHIVYQLDPFCAWHTYGHQLVPLLRILQLLYFTGHFCDVHTPHCLSCSLPHSYYEPMNPSSMQRAVLGLVVHIKLKSHPFKVRSPCPVMSFPQRVKVLLHGITEGEVGS